ncbi:TadE/TadG family type IV pilus assembly protein [Nitratireductor sp. GCM10026969]|uniref:TadE/TadG family type IV pilus assembly protein n=1 Tax=Nitratireductor sp. GCM10026969 TaxID=3252645 RepID=UPI003609D08A
MDGKYTVDKANSRFEYSGLYPGRVFRGRMPVAFVRSEAGVSAIEFALVAPVFLFLFMGMIAYGIYFGAMHSMQQLAADAARASIPGLDETERTLLARRFIENHSSGYPFITADRIAVDVADSADGTQFVVSLQYDAGDLPIWGLWDGLSLPGKVIERASTIRIGGI